MFKDDDKKIPVEWALKNDLLLVFYRGKTGIEWNWLHKGATELKLALTSSRESAISSYINPNMTMTEIVSIPIRKLRFRKGVIYNVEIGIASSTPYERKALAIDVFKTLKFRGVQEEVIREVVAYLGLDYEIYERN